MSVSAEYNLKCKVTDTPALSLDLASDPSFDHEISSSSGTLTASSTVPATTVWSDSRTLTAGRRAVPP